jgi:hypothetical protein
MLTLFNSAIGMALALALLILAIVAPFLALWIALSMRRDIGRIAVALERTNRAESYAARERHDAAMEAPTSTVSRVSNSAFGR